MHMIEKHWKDAQQKVNSGYLGRGVRWDRVGGNGVGEKTFKSKNISRDIGALSVF